MRLCKLSATALAITTWCAGSSCAQAVRRSSTPSWHMTARCLSIPNRNRVEHVALLDLPVQVISRPASSSPSVGQMKRHVEQQQELINAAFAVSPPWSDVL